MMTLIISLSLLLVAQTSGLWTFTPETISEYGFADPTFADEEFGHGLICDASNMPVLILSGVVMKNGAGYWGITNRNLRLDSPQSVLTMAMA
jgi:hypothetical protein